MVTATPSDIFDYASRLSSRGDPEDLVLAASLLPDAKIFAALRLSKQATKVSMATSILLSGLSPVGYFLSALCLPCIPLCISGVVDSMKNTLNIITDKGIVTAVVDHKVAGCSPCKTSKDYVEIPYESIAVVEPDSKEVCCSSRKVPNVHLIVTDRQPRDRFLYFEEPEEVANLIRRLKDAKEQSNIIQQQQHHPTTAAPSNNSNTIQQQPLN